MMNHGDTESTEKSDTSRATTLLGLNMGSSPFPLSLFPFSFGVGFLSALRVSVVQTH